MIRVLAPAAVALASISAAAILWGGALALFTESDAVGSNTFATADCFPSSNTGFLDATSEAADTGGDADGFELNPANAFSDGGGFASNVDGAGDNHRFYDYGVSLHSSCAVAGIEVQIDWFLDDVAGVSSIDVELSWDGGTSWTAAKTDVVESTTERTGLLGGAADTWGRAWTALELGDANFRVRVTAVSDTGTRDFFLDWVAVKVYYGP